MPAMSMFSCVSLNKLFMTNETTVCLKIFRKITAKYCIVLEKEVNMKIEKIVKLKRLNIEQKAGNRKITIESTDTIKEKIEVRKRDWET